MGAKVTDSPEPVSVTCRGGFEIPLAAERAARLFTPEGEREWVDGWDPAYPDPDADREAVGTVFLTSAHGSEIRWVITAAEPMVKRYARFDPRGIVAVIEVELADADAGGARVEVTYRMTALDESARGELAEFEAGYDEYMEEWRTAIGSFLSSGRG